jgi:hypothetical protein
MTVHITLERARQARETARIEFSKYAPVTFVGVTKIGENFALSIGLKHAPQPGVILPSNIEGVGATWKVVGEVMAQA